MTQKRDTPYVCGIDAAIDVVGGKWKVLILWELSDGPRRFAQIHRSLTPVSEKVLNQHLRQLEADKIISRTVYPEVPPKVEYELTEPGKELGVALEPLGLWGRKHRWPMIEPH